MEEGQLRDIVKSTFLGPLKLPKTLQKFGSNMKECVKALKLLAELQTALLRIKDDVTEGFKMLKDQSERDPEGNEMKEHCSLVASDTDLSKSQVFACQAVRLS